MRDLLFLERARDTKIHLGFPRSLLSLFFASVCFVHPLKIKVADVALFLSDIQLLEFSPIRAAQGNVLVGTPPHVAVCPWAEVPLVPLPSSEAQSSNGMWGGNRNRAHRQILEALVAIVLCLLKE